MKNEKAKTIVGTSRIRYIFTYEYHFEDSND